MGTQCVTIRSTALTASAVGITRRNQRRLSALVTDESGSSGITIYELAQALEARQTGDHKWMARCPAHQDKTPSLSFCEKNGKILLHCFAGCSQSAVIRALVERGLWTTKQLTPFERDLQRKEWIASQRKARSVVLELRAWISTLDNLKLTALETGDDSLYASICRNQFEAQSEYQKWCRMYHAQL